MTGKTQKRREALRAALIEAAERRIADSGFRGLTARDLAKEVGCAVGAIYTIFRDMDALAAAVNARTTARLEQAVAIALAGETDGDARRQLVLLGQTYFGFVLDNPRLWSAIFELGYRGEGDDLKPEAEHARLIGHVARPLERLLPDMEAARRLLVARSLFAAVHGIVSLGQQSRFMPVPPSEVSAQIAFIIEAFCDGAVRRRQGEREA
ncbi:MAG: TetR/AcrR family transcriptional regulator [Rhizobiaceae bacterium]|nr:TetR/AcrR family transcriptional regulator [Rhizobiaceae bacterium]